MTAQSSSEDQSSAVTENANRPEPEFGWTQYAEQINGRFAMIGFVALLVMEVMTRQDFFTWIGLR